MGIITRNNLTNWRWYVAFFITFIFGVLISPLVILGFIIDILSDVFDWCYDSISKVSEPQFKKIKIMGE